MNTRTVDPRTVWAILAMEAALALPIISLPTQGDRIPGLTGPLLLVLLLPAGYAAIYLYENVRDPSWRLLVGIGLALLTRLIVSYIPEEDLSGLMVWLGRSVAPAVIGIALWWRGGALAVAEVTPGEVRTEFSVLAVVLVAILALVRPFLLPDPLLLGGAVGAFAIAGLIGTALSRQEAADVGGLRMSRALAVGTALVPAGLAVLFVGILRPQLLTSMWLLLARVIELILTPIGLLLAWLASLFPRSAPGAPVVPPPIATPPPLNPEAFANAQDQFAWIGWLIIFTLLLAAGGLAILAARMLLANFIGAPQKPTPARDADDVVSEPSGTPGRDAANIFGWLMRWVRTWFASRPRSASARREGLAVESGAVDAWTAYQRLLNWADRRGLGRRPFETTGQLSKRLVSRVPEAADAVDLVTQTYEWERYGSVHPPRDRVRALQAAIARLSAADAERRTV